MANQQSRESIEKHLSTLTLLHSYQNGNVKVRIYTDGTKVRETDGEDEPFLPELPESCDCKITNWCDGTVNGSTNQCYWCHEKSNINGRHANIEKLLTVLKDMPPGAELAVGGGATLSHPQILDFLYGLKQLNLIANVTINQKHIKRDKPILETMFKDDLVKGIGISYSDPAYLDDIGFVLEKSAGNAVFHLIMGVNKVSDIDVLYKLCQQYKKPCKVLMLGYKHFGLGINYYLRNKGVEENKSDWIKKLPSYLLNGGKQITMAFDNLAIEQLKLESVIDPATWKLFYQGDDFSHTMYIDAVEEKFAPTSCSEERQSFNDYTLKEYFQRFKRDCGKNC